MLENDKGQVRDDYLASIITTSDFYDLNCFLFSVNCRLE